MASLFLIFLAKFEVNKKNQRIHYSFKEKLQEDKKIFDKNIDQKQ